MRDALTAGHHPNCGVHLKSPCNCAEAEIERLRAVLTMAKDFIAEIVESAVECACPTGPDGKPDRSRMDEPSRPGIEEMEAVLATVTAALGSDKGTKP